jgi:hypothetical protein
MKDKKKIITIILLFSIYFTSLPVHQVNAQINVQVFKGYDLITMPDGYYGLSNGDGETIFDAKYTHLYFEKKNKYTIEGGGAYYEIGVNNISIPINFCIKGAVFDDEIVFTRVIKPDGKTSLIQNFRNIELENNYDWILRYLRSDEIREDSFSFNSPYVQCKKINEFYNEFESLYEDAKNFQKLLIEDYKPITEKGSIIVGNTKKLTEEAELAIKNYRIQVKRFSEEISRDLEDRKITAQEAFLQVKSKRNNLTKSSAAKRNAIKTGINQLLAQKQDATFLNTLDTLSKKEYKKDFKILSVKQRSQIVALLLEKYVSSIVEKAKDLEKNLSKVSKLLNKFDTALSIATYITSEDLISDILKEVLDKYARNIGYSVGGRIAGTACFILGPASALVCTVVITFTSLILFQMAKDEGIDALTEWAELPKYNFFDDFIFKAIEP